MAAQSYVFLLFVLSSFYVDTFAYNKYSEEVNLKEQSALDRPFRIQKVNIIWEKAQKRLSGGKLKDLFRELTTHDKEEITWKHLKAEGQDKDGLKEAALRHKLRGIMNRYDLLELFDHLDLGKKNTPANIKESLDKLMFKDKKLNKLWLKAEQSGFTDEELKTLKEEFQHHEEKVEEFHQLLNEAGHSNNNNNILDNSVKQYVDGSKPKSTEEQLKEKKAEVKEGYERLGRLAALGPEDSDLTEPRVRELWRLAQKGDFNEEELGSLREELRHYQHRLSKLKHLQSERELADTRLEDKWQKDKPESVKHMETRLKQYEHKVNKLHNEIEGRIMQRHLEL